MNETPYLTPTFSMVLNKNLLELTEAQNRGLYDTAYKILKTIVNMLKEEHYTPLMENGIKQVEKQLAQVRSIRGVDEMDSRLKRRNGTWQVLHHNLPRLFRALMLQLHEGNYLEKEPVKPRYTKRKKLSVE